MLPERYVRSLNKKKHEKNTKKLTHAPIIDSKNLVNDLPGRTNSYRFENNCSYIAYARNFTPIDPVKYPHVF